ncbi:MAG: SpoIID/LytB domain-containing protein [Candidatus Latescibacterota bacterium]
MSNHLRIYSIASKNPRWRLGALLAFVVLLAVTLSACSGMRSGRRFSTAGQGPDIRALISQGARSVKIVSTGAHQVVSSGILLGQSRSAGQIEVIAQQSMLYFRLEPEGNVATADGEVYLVPLEGSVFSIEGIAYPGQFKLYNSEDGVSVVNVLPLEKYLKGVLPHEMGNPGPHAYGALQAQAIAARTYALAKMRSRKEEPFDVYASVKDQVYRGSEGTFELSDGAVRETAGYVVTYKEKLAQTYYCASCGGHTSDIRRVWPAREAAPYLTGIRDIESVSQKTSCREGRRFRWRHSFSGRRLGEIVRITLPKELGVDESAVGALHDIRILGRGASGRVSMLEIETDGGVYRVQGDRIRWVLMTDPELGRILPSTLFDLEKKYKGDNVSFVSIVGGGNGHGVGMCQYGAIGMAKQGYTFDMILSHYYPGCSIKREY